MKSGWCGQLGRANHRGCKVPAGCSCWCHDEAVGADDNGVIRGSIGAQVKSGPTRECDLAWPGLTPVLHYQNGG